MASGRTPIIKIKNIAKIYKSKRKREENFFRRLLPGKRFHTQKSVEALLDLNLTIFQGELFGLLGPNGAGKTTLIKILSTLLEPTSGDAWVCDCNIREFPNEVRGKIGIVFSGERSLYWKLTGRENLKFFSSLYHLPAGLAKRRINELLEKVRLTERADEYVENYSSGMRQRLVIAKSLLSDPPVLLLDEPTVGIDPRGAREIRELIRWLAKRGKTIVLTTHNLQEADTLCDRVAILNNGRTIAVDRPDVLKRRLIGFVVVEILCTPMRNSLLESLKSMREVSEIRQLSIEGAEPAGKLSILAHTSPKTIVIIWTKLKSNVVDIDSFVVKDPTLEEAFIKLTDHFIDGNGKPRESKRV